jgi:hypothetical protein
MLHLDAVCTSSKLTKQQQHQEAVLRYHLGKLAHTLEHNTEARVLFEASLVIADRLRLTALKANVRKATAGGPRCKPNCYRYLLDVSRTP